MTTPDVKRLAFATMDHAVDFELHITSGLPGGEHVVEIARGEDVASILPAARFVARMARTFFPDKLKGKVSTAPPDGTVGVYLVCKLPELEADFMESWESTPAAANRR